MHAQMIDIQAPDCATCPVLKLTSRMQQEIKQITMDLIAAQGEITRLERELHHRKIREEL